MRSVLDAAASPVKACILIVEDEGLIACDLEHHLVQAGYAIAGIVDSGEEAIERVGQGGVDLVFMDIRLQGEMDGIEAAHHLEDRYDVPIIYLTAHSDRETLNRAKVTSPFGYLAKPIPFGILQATIEIALYRHKADQQLREQRAWLRTALQTMADCVLIADRRGCVQYVNPAAENLTGLLSDQALHQPVLSILRTHDPEGACDFEALLKESLLTGKDRPFSGTKLLTAENRKVPIEGVISPSTDTSGSVGMVITFRDTTGREEHERELRQEQKMMAVGRLAAGISHDFNNLLTVIVGHTALLLGNTTDVSEPVRPALKEILKAGSAAAGLTKQLLSFSRQVGQLRPVSINAVILEHENICRSLLGATIQWRVRLSPDTKLVHADPGHLAQVLMNLVVNASDAMPAGGALTVITEACRSSATPDLRSEADDEFVMLSVADTGAGIASEAIGHIFEPFFTTKAVGQGTGLGLSIVHTIVTSLGGKIAVDSTPGAGTTFRIYLPIDKTSVSNPSESTQTAALTRTLAPGTVLLVDDNDGVRRLLLNCLQGCGYQVLQAADPEDALALAASHSGTIDLLVTDVVMPKMDGFRLAEKLTACRPDIKILFISGYAGNHIGLPHGARFLQKPFKPGELQAHLEQLFHDATGNLTA